ncbi:MAG: DUF3108 domain-containing protein [Muribaculaceae bacterium]|nr:DUF3108 domain-containing protein [Muribaculaceae bacterium]
MKRVILLILGAVIALISSEASAAGFSNESLHYVISYKWGLIHKDAGDATLSLHRNGNNYDLMLTAKTKPWADKIYEVRDTLLGKLRIADMKPLSYSKIAHEKGRYSRDDISYSFSGATATGVCKRLRTHKDGSVVVTDKKLTGSGPVYDMLSVFYYLRLINYDDLQKGKEAKATIFSGSKAESISIRCLGKEKIKLRDKSEREAYHIQFTFTTDGKKKSSDDIDTWISADSKHIPLYMVGKLPVGQVRVYFIK